MTNGYEDLNAASNGVRRRRRIYFWVVCGISAVLALIAGSVAFFVKCIDAYQKPGLQLGTLTLTGVLTSFCCFTVLMLIMLFPLYWPPKG